MGNGGKKILKKQIIMLGIVVMLICVGLSGCNEIDSGGEQSTTLPDGTVATGDVGEIQITEYNITKKAVMRWNVQYQQWKISDSGDSILEYDSDITFQSKNNAKVDWYLNISDVEKNESKRKEIYLKYIKSEKIPWELDSRIPIAPYTAYLIEGFYSSTEKASYHRINVISNLRKDSKPIWYVNGTAKNIGDNFLDYPKIKVNFYNANGSWLASKSDSDYTIPSGYTWHFSIKYDGEFRNDVSYISFAVSAS